MITTFEELIISTGEHPEDAHRRLTKEAFFPVRLQELFFKNIKKEASGDLFQPAHLYNDVPYGTDIELVRHMGVLDIERRNIITVVTKEHYELITNEELCDFVRREIIPRCLIQVAASYAIR